MKTKIVWSSPGEYVFRKWVFDFSHYRGLTTWIRVFGLLVQRYNNNERVVTHPITGSKHTL